MTENRPGGSAQAEYNRRSARHVENLRRRRPRILSFCAAMAIVALVVAIVISPPYGAVVLMLDVILVMSALFGTPNSIIAWQIGADGEVRTGRLLESLEADGFRILHDRKIPGARSANIDHIVIGPPGIYVVETTHPCRLLRQERRPAYKELSEEFRLFHNFKRDSPSRASWR